MRQIGENSLTRDYSGGGSARSDSRIKNQKAPCTLDTTISIATPNSNMNPINAISVFNKDKPKCQPWQKLVLVGPKEVKQPDGTLGFEGGRFTCQSRYSL
jgi:hypothetical protein